MVNKEKNFISAVVYVHNAEMRIGSFLDSVTSVLEKNFENIEIICVDDASDDRSIDVIKERGADGMAGGSISIISMNHFQGLEPAMVAGVDLSIGDYVFEFDSTILDFDVDAIMDVYRRSLEGYDIVSASPDQKCRLSSRVFYLVFGRFSNFQAMSTERFRILSRRVINRVSSMNKSVFYRKASYFNCGLKMDNIKYPVKNGVSMSTFDKKEKHYRVGFAINSLILFTEIGYKFSVSMTVLMMLITLSTLAYTLLVYFTSHPVEGWTTTVLFFSICFFGLFGIQTVIVKYLQLLVDMVFKREYYSVRDIEKLTK